MSAAAAGDEDVGDESATSEIDVLRDQIAKLNTEQSKLRAAVLDKSTATEIAALKAELAKVTQQLTQLQSSLPPIINYFKQHEKFLIGGAKAVAQS